MHGTHNFKFSQELEYPVSFNVIRPAQHRRFLNCCTERNIFWYVTFLPRSWMVEVPPCLCTRMSVRISRGDYVIRNLCTSPHRNTPPEQCRNLHLQGSPRTLQNFQVRISMCMQSSCFTSGCGETDVRGQKWHKSSAIVKVRWNPVITTLVYATPLL